MQANVSLRVKSVFVCPVFLLDFKPGKGRRSEGAYVGSENVFFWSVDRASLLFPLLTRIGNLRRRGQAALNS